MKRPVKSTAGSNFVFSHEQSPVLADELAEGDFAVPVVNHTASAVSFEDVKSSCTCSGATLDKKSLEPGEQTTLRISANLRHRSGRQIFTATLFESSGRFWQYRVGVNVYERACVDVPNAVLSLGQLVPGATVEREITLLLHSLDDHHFPSVVSVVAERPDVQLSQLPDIEVEKLGDGLYVRRLRYRLEHRVPTEPGSYSGLVVFRYACEEEERTVRLTLGGYVASLYEVNPRHVVFRPTAEGGVCRVLVRRMDGKPIQVKGLQVSTSEVAVTS